MRRRDLCSGLLASAVLAPAVSHAAGADGPPEPPARPEVAQSSALVEAYWSAIGPVDADVITYIVNPMFMGAPPWPNTRQSYSIIRPENSLIIASNGLSDPFPETDNRDQGFGCEVFIEAPELAGASFETIRASWIFKAVESFAMNVADMGGISDVLDRYGVISTELPIDGAPASFTSRRGTVGALVNLETPYPSRLALPLEEINIVPVTMISARELESIVRGGNAARQALAAERLSRGGGHKTVSRR